MTGSCLRMPLTRKAFSVCLGDYHDNTCIHMLSTCVEEMAKIVGIKPFLRRVALRSDVAIRFAMRPWSHQESNLYPCKDVGTDALPAP